MYDVLTNVGVNNIMTFANLGLLESNDKTRERSRPIDAEVRSDKAFTIHLIKFLDGTTRKSIIIY
jgi:hypothetical protein